jgi:hypothetical protein
MAGTASTGSAQSVANTSTDDAVMPDAAAAAGIPARVSIEYCIAPDAATPPGTIRPNAFDVSCEVITGPHSCVRSDSRCTPHMQP